MKEIWLSADYDAGPLWVATSNGLVSVDSAQFALSPALVVKLDAWVERFNALRDSNYEWVDSTTRQRWVDDGVALAVEVQAELGSDFDVKLAT